MNDARKAMTPTVVVLTITLLLGLQPVTTDLHLRALPTMQPCGQTGSVGPFPEKASTAASMSGFLMMLTAFCAGLVLGRSFNGTVFPLTLGVGFFGVLLAVVAWTLVQRDGDPSAHHSTLPAQA